MGKEERLFCLQEMYRIDFLSFVHGNPGDTVAPASTGITAQSGDCWRVGVPY